MASGQRRCPKCANRMEEGFLLDVSHTAYLQSHWVSGKPEKSFWTGLKVKGKGRRAITNYRCVRCGYLEAYAADEVK